MRRAAKAPLFTPFLLLAMGLAGGACTKDKEETSEPAPAPAATPAAVSGTVQTTSGTVTAAGGQTTATGTQASTNQSKYQTSNTPGTIALELPLALTAPKSASLNLQSDDDAGASTEESEGFNTLRGKIAEIPPLLSELTERLFEFDAVLPAVEAKCATNLGAAWTTCSTDAVTTTFTKAMADGVIANIGADQLGDDLVTELRARADAMEVVELGTMNVTKLTADPNGYTKCVELVLSETETTRYCFNAADTKIDHKDTASGGGEGHYSLSFKAAEDLLTLVYQERGAEYVHNDKFTLKKNPAARGPHGVIFTASIDDMAAGYGIFGMSQTGIADDLGGVVSTKYTWRDQLSGTYTLSAATTPDAHYLVAPAAATTAADVVQQYLGFLDGTGTNNETNTLMYWGPIPAGTGAKLWLATTPDSGATVLTDSGITITASAITADDSVLFYREEFGSHGDLTFWCYKESENGACEGGTGSAGEYSSDYDDVAEDDSAFEGSVDLVFTGANANALALNGGDIYVFPATYEVEGVSYDSDEWYYYELATASFQGDSEALSSTDMMDYSIYVDALSADAFTSVKVYRLLNGVFTEVTSITVTAE